MSLGSIKIPRRKAEKTYNPRAKDHGSINILILVIIPILVDSHFENEHLVETQQPQ